MTKKIISVENEESFKEFAKFMKEEQIYELKVPITTPDDREFDINIIYEPLTAFQIMKINEDAPDNNKMTVEEKFDYMCEMFNESIRNWRFVNVARGKADYEHGELSVRDLRTDARVMIQAAIAPGMMKSVDSVEQDIKSNSRKVGRGLRRDALPVAPADN